MTDRELFKRFLLVWLILLSLMLPLLVCNISGGGGGPVSTVGVVVIDNEIDTTEYCESEDVP